MGIEVINVTKSFGIAQTPVLKGITQTISSGEMVAITGRSGSGKSTLLYIMSSLDKASTGKVIVDGADLSKLDTRELHAFRNTKMGFVFQFHHLLPELTAIENVLMPAMKTGKEVTLKKFAMELLDEFALADKADRLPSQLSGGEQQRIAIARALVMKPSYLFADEPTGNLDTANGTLILSHFKRINKAGATTIIYVTHDHEFARMSSRQISLVDGLVA